MGVSKKVIKTQNYNYFKLNCNNTMVYCAISAANFLGKDESIVKNPKTCNFLNLTRLYRSIFLQSLLLPTETCFMNN